jgi:hypothetical protein
MRGSEGGSLRQRGKFGFVLSHPFARDQKAGPSTRFAKDERTGHGVSWRLRFPEPQVLRLPFTSFRVAQDDKV